MRACAAVVVTSLALASSVAASPASKLAKRASNTPPVTVQGNAFFANGQRFYVRGVDYQPGGASSPVDPLANAATCQRDIAEFQKLGLNTVRVYIVDNTANHDECMNALAAAGMYLALDVNNGKYSINRADPTPSYNDVYLQNIFATIDAFHGYDNTLLFFSGNEVINAPDNTNCAPFIKAVTRDMKQYIGSRGYRSIPVGYSAADVEENRYQTAAFMNCGTADERSDFFSFNDYSWCDPNTFDGSGWAAKVQQYSNYSIPLFLSEYGCNKPSPPRAFEEVAALYNAEMTSVYSGGLVYEYSEESDNPNYGLVTINSGTSVSENTDFANLQSMLSANPAPTGSGGYKTGLPPLACPTQDANWQVSGDALPAIPSPAVKYMTQGAGPGPGLNGPGSQNAGVESAGTATPGSGQVTVTATTSSPSAAATSKAAAAALAAPQLHYVSLVCAIGVVSFFFLGATLL